MLRLRPAMTATACTALALCCLWTAAWAAPAASRLAPRAVTVADDKTDTAGTVLAVTWKAPLAPKSLPGQALVGYQLSTLNTAEKGAKPAPAGSAGPAELEGTVGDLQPGVAYKVTVAALYAPVGKDWYAPGDKPAEGAEDFVEARAVKSAPAGPAKPVGLWFDPGKINVLVGLLVYGIIVVLCFVYARKRDMYIRPIAGLEAVDDAVGRATEMGKPMLYVAGLSGLGEVTTIASVLILGHLARRTAAYETPILVPCFDPMVMTAEREIVREAYLEAGRPQSYRPDNIFYVTDSQFGYVAAVDGIMLREKPAANFFMGSFAAESLILAETGNMTGAIQVAGTDSDTQIPFFITACDYTLMGEELYAAGAYLSRAPSLMAQLKGQDIGKAIILSLIVLTTLAITTCHLAGWEDAAKFILKWFAT